MRIVDERDKDTMQFHEIGIGSCFEYDGNFYIKCDKYGSNTNAVRLTTGDKAIIEHSEQVQVLDVELVIKG